MIKPECERQREREREREMENARAREGIERDPREILCNANAFGAAGKILECDGT